MAIEVPSEAEKSESHGRVKVESRCDSKGESKGKSKSSSSPANGIFSGFKEWVLKSDNGKGSNR